MRTDFLKTALKVAELKSFSRTAEELFLARTTVNFQIRSLEKEIGFKIFKRGFNYRVLITKEGATYLLWVSQALSMLEQGMLEAKEQSA